jgi:DNA-directed RNA polymerase specialized sigma24 family protein
LLADGTSYREAARRLGVSEGAIRQALRRDASLSTAR